MKKEVKVDIEALREYLAHCENVIEMAERCRNAYFWSPSGNARGRRANEDRNNIPKETFEYNGVEWEIGYSYEESCKNVYAKGLYCKDGKRTTLTAVRGLVKRLTAEIEILESLEKAV